LNLDITYGHVKNNSVNTSDSKKAITNVSIIALVHCNHDYMSVSALRHGHCSWISRGKGALWVVTDMLV